MKDWKDRPVEVRNLDNPAFCGVIIYLCVNEYQRKSNKNFPFPLVYLVLPLVLTTPIRANISSRTNLVNWAQRYPELLINFGKRTKDLVEITNEAVEFVMQAGYLQLTSEGELSCCKKLKGVNQEKNPDQEVKDCFDKAKHVARWFANTQRVETIYICLGVRP